MQPGGTRGPEMAKSVMPTQDGKMEHVAGLSASESSHHDRCAGGGVSSVGTMWILSDKPERRGRAPQPVHSLIIPRRCFPRPVTSESANILKANQLKEHTTIPLAADWIETRLASHLSTCLYEIGLLWQDDLRQPREWTFSDIASNRRGEKRFAISLCSHEVFPKNSTGNQGLFSEVTREFRLQSRNSAYASASVSPFSMEVKFLFLYLMTEDHNGTDK
jgi:hypothetical protein